MLPRSRLVMAAEMCVDVFLEKKVHQLLHGEVGKAGHLWSTKWSHFLLDGCLGLNVGKGCCKRGIRSGRAGGNTHLKYAFSTSFHILHGWIADLRSQATFNEDCRIQAFRHVKEEKQLPERFQSFNSRSRFTCPTFHPSHTPARSYMSGEEPCIK